MATIKLLAPDLANQIAAGEVVERPASVVKELVENALDAGSRRISVHIELGGKRLVRVEDDGVGMGPEDARLAIERHATSKIARADDLAAITTLGFRGEALPSIASVSHFVLRTRARGDESGTEIRVNGGAVAAVVEAAAAEGTVVEVNDLFYNLPARRKFLKADGAESAQVSRVLTQLALSHPTIGFTLTSAGRTVLQWPPSGSLRDRMYQVYGDRPDLMEIRKEAGGIGLTGFIAALAEQGPTRGPQHVFINGRIVKDKTIAHAIIHSYSQASIKERSPEVHLFLEMPAGALDVNVHPTKAEVRFRDQSLVHEVVRRALMQALGHSAAPQLQLRPEIPPPRSPIATALPGVLGGGVYPNRWLPEAVRLKPDTTGNTATGAEGASAVGRTPDPTGNTATGAEAASAVGRTPDPTGNTATGAEGASAAGRTPDPTGSGVAGADGASVVSGFSRTVTVAAPIDVKPMIPLGQFRDTFIIAVDDQGVAIIDQHVAHERVLFERVMEAMTAGRLESQRLLVPVLLDLAPSAHQALVNRAAELERFGFEVESFGASTIKVTAVPALLKLEDSSKALLALAEDLEGLESGAHVQDALQRIAATTACHAAVKANAPLTYEKMTHILDELRATAYSTVCPHGRPVMLRLTRREIEKNFDRI